MIFAVAFIPASDVVMIYNKMTQELPFFQEKDAPNEEQSAIQKLLIYFEKTFVGALMRNVQRRKTAKFDVELWNVFELTIQGSCRTNNVIEGWHNAMTRFVNRKNPSIFAFIKNIKNEQCVQEMRMIQIASFEPTQPRKKHMDQHYRLLQIARKYSEMDSLEYVKAIANVLWQMMNKWQYNQYSLIQDTQQPITLLANSLLT